MCAEFRRGLHSPSLVAGCLATSFRMSFIQETAGRFGSFWGRESWLIRHMRPAYESLLDWSGKGKGIPWPINGVTYRIDPHYRHMLWQDYDAPVASFLSDRVKPGAMCFDVGANIGVYVLQFAHWSGPTGSVIAFEPNPFACDILRRHIQLNDLEDRVTLVPAAIGSSKGEAVLYAAGADGMSRLGAPNELIADRVSEVTVPVFTLDDYCESEGLMPDWLFIDIEGFEIAALSGARRLIKTRGKDLQIVVEMHPSVWPSADTTPALAEALLAELGLDLEPLTGQTDSLRDYGLVYLSRR
jgi:FkbM family methyltransferase